MKKKHKLVFGPLALGLCAVPTDQSLAAFDAFLKIDGIPGESMDSKHKDEIDVLSWSWGETQSGTLSLSNSWNFKISKALDKSSPLLYVCSAGRSNLTQVILTVRKAGQQQQEYMTIKMSDVLISGCQSGGGAADLAAMPTEEVSFNFQKIEWTYQAFTPDGLPSGSPIVTSWSNTIVSPGGTGSVAASASPK